MSDGARITRFIESFMQDGGLGTSLHSFPRPGRSRLLQQTFSPFSPHRRAGSSGEALQVGCLPGPVHTAQGFV